MLTLAAHRNRSQAPKEAILYLCETKNIYQGCFTFSLSCLLKVHRSRSHAGRALTLASTSTALCLLSLVALLLLMLTLMLLPLLTVLTLSVLSMLRVLCVLCVLNVLCVLCVLTLIVVILVGEAEYGVCGGYLRALVVVREVVIFLPFT